MLFSGRSSLKGVEAHASTKLILLPGVFHLSPAAAGKLLVTSPETSGCIVGASGDGNTTCTPLCGLCGTHRTRKLPLLLSLLLARSCAVFELDEAGRDTGREPGRGMAPGLEIELSELTASATMLGK